MKVAILTTDNREHYREYTAAAPHFGTAPEALLQGLTRYPEVEIHIVSCARARMQPEQRLGPNIYFHSLHVPALGWMRTAYFGCITAVRKKLREIQPDLVHGQGTERDCAINAVLSGFPNILTIHGNMRLVATVNQARPFSFFWLAARLEAFTIPRSAGVVCITRHTQQAVQGLARRTWLVPNAVDASFFDIQRQTADNAPPRILCVGLVCLHKNQNALIRALDGLARQRPFELLFLGMNQPKTPYGAEFLRLVQERPWCRHGGFADREQLKAHIANAALLALPSLEENCPMVVLEAMAAGLPVVAAKVGGVPELVEDGATGWLCDPLAPESMSSAVETALASVAGGAKIAEQARVGAQERFHPRVIGELHLKIYRQIVG